MLFFLLINVKMPKIVGILTFSRKNFMLNGAEHEQSFITSGPGYATCVLLLSYTSLINQAFVFPLVSALCRSFGGRQGEMYIFEHRQPSSTTNTTNITGRSGGAMVLGKLAVPGRPTNLDYRRARAYCACSRCGWGLFGHFYSRLSFLFSVFLSGRRPDID